MGGKSYAQAYYTACLDAAAPFAAYYTACLDAAAPFASDMAAVEAVAAA